MRSCATQKPGEYVLVTGDEKFSSFEIGSGPSTLYRGQLAFQAAISLRYDNQTICTGLTWVSLGVTLQGGQCFRQQCKLDAGRAWMDNTILRAGVRNKKPQMTEFKFSVVYVFYCVYLVLDGDRYQHRDEYCFCLTETVFVFFIIWKVPYIF